MHRTGAALLLAAAHGASALQLDISSEASIAHAAFVVSHGMTSYYSGNESGQAPGYLPGEGTPTGYYWWEGSGFFGSLIDYWYYTGDDTFNAITTQALTWQMGPDKNYEPLNASQTLGNDDIGFWAMAAMKAAELKFPNPPPDQGQWVPVVQRVFNDLADRWDTSTCNGGIHWQASRLSTGYHLKVAVANGALFNIAARLGKYSGNQTYFEWANKVWDWTNSVNLIDPEKGFVEDSVDSVNNCTTTGGNPWTYNQGLYMYGAACMLNATGDNVWQTRTNSLLAGMKKNFVRDNVVTEIGCQDTVSCNNDQKSFKSYVMMWLAETIKVAPYTSGEIMPILQGSAKGAAASCSGGDDGVTCGVNWNDGKWDNTKGIGQQMCALEAFNALLTPYKAGPIKSFSDGGLSAIDPNSGSSPASDLDPFPPLSSSDYAGAGIVTFLLIGSTLATALWMSTDNLGQSLKSTLGGRVFLRGKGY